MHHLNINDTTQHHCNYNNDKEINNIQNKITKININSNYFVISNEIRETLATNFNKCVKGYHIINNNPIKEALWEDITPTEKKNETKLIYFYIF